MGVEAVFHSLRGIPARWKAEQAGREQKGALLQGSAGCQHALSTQGQAWEVLQDVTLLVCLGLEAPFRKGVFVVVNVGEV